MRWLAPLLLLLAAVGLAGCYEHHLLARAHVTTTDAGPRDAAPRIDAPPPPPPVICADHRRLVGPETGRAGDECACGAAWPHHPGPFVVVGDFAYRHGVDLEVIDVSTPREPMLVGHMEGDSRATAIVATAGALVLAGAAVHVYDLGDPLRPRSLGSLPGVSGATAAVASGSLVFVASTTGADRAGVGVVTVRAFDLADPAAPVALGVIELDDHHYVREMEIGGEALWLSLTTWHDAEPLFTTDLVVIDVREPRALAVASLTPLGDPMERSDISAMSAADGVVSLFDYSDLGRARLFETAEPRAPRLVAELTRYTSGVFMIGDHLAVGSGFFSPVPTERTHDIVLYDVSDPTVPVEAGHTPYRENWGHATVVGNALLVSGARALVAFPLCD